MIRHLADSMPGVRIDTVELDETTVEPLDAVMAQLPPEGAGPVMITGLEKAVSSAEPEHPVLFHLNLSRPEWPRKVPRPVVLWVPEYVLGFLGREAPDFLDWRSDTLHFPEPAEQELWLFDSKIWQGGEDGRMPEPERRARIAELRARLAQGIDTADPSVLAAYSDWTIELGSHLFFLGELKEAERMLRGALAVEEALDRPQKRATLCHKLGEVYLAMGRFVESECFFSNAISLRTEEADPLENALSYSKLILLKVQQGETAKIPDLLSKFSELLPTFSFLEEESTENRADLESSGKLADMYTSALLSLSEGRHWLDEGDLEQAEAAATRALAANQQLGHQAGAAEDYILLGQVYRKRGDLDQAEKYFQRVLEIGGRLGSPPLLVEGSLILGDLHRQRGEYAKAREAWTRVRDLYAQMGVDKSFIQKRLDSLREPSSLTSQEHPPST